MKKVYIICPVRNCDEETRADLDEYVDFLESSNEYQCHYPPRDVDQSLSGFEICEAHREAMLECDEVHVWWDKDSKGSHFDFGMTFALNKKIVLINDIPETPFKSYGNVLNYLSNL